MHLIPTGGLYFVSRLLVGLMHVVGDLKILSRLLSLLITQEHPKVDQTKNIEHERGAKNEVHRSVSTCTPVYIFEYFVLFLIVFRVFVRFHAFIVCNFSCLPQSMYNMDIQTRYMCDTYACRYEKDVFLYTCLLYTSPSPRD